MSGKKFGRFVSRSVLALAVVAVAATVFGEERHVSQDEAYEWLVAGEILERIKAPTFPERDFDIRDFGAKEGVEGGAGEAIWTG